MKNMMLLCCSFVLLFTGCSKSGYEKAVDGVWQEKSIIGKFAGTSHWIRFIPADKTFEMKLSHFTDMLDTAQLPCSDNRTDFVKGTYEINGTQITFNGRYCNESFARSSPIVKEWILTGPPIPLFSSVTIWFSTTKKMTMRKSGW